MAGASELNLAAKGFGPGLGPLLAGSPDVAKLTSLDVSDNDLGIDGARALAGSPRWGELRELDLGGNDIGDEGANAIAHAPGVSGAGDLERERQFHRQRRHQCFGQRRVASPELARSEHE
jgi:Leucine Rich repeat